MRRRYAFEAEEISEEVKAQLEKVEDVVEDKCDDEEACNKMIEKIEDQEEKFNEALSDMASAAKDCKDGTCSKSDMASAIAPKMAELKEVAKSIGVATEEETLSEDELKDAKDYLEGAKEIVEAKLDELGDGDDSDDDDDDDEADGDADEDDGATEAFLNMAESAMESAYLEIAMEGANVTAVSATKKCLAQIRATRKVMKSAARGNRMSEAADAARECESYATDLISALNDLDNSVGSAILANIGFAILGILVGAKIGRSAGKVMARGAGGEWARSKAIVDEVDRLTKQGWVNNKAEAWDSPNIRAISATQGQNAKNQFMAQKFRSGDKAGRTIGVSLGVGSIAGTTAMGALAKKKGAISADGEPMPSKFSANDANALLAALKADARRLKAKYAKLAASYSHGDSSAEESFFDVDCYEPATEGQTWQSVKSVLGKKARQARKLIRGSKVLAENDPESAITSLRQAKVLLQEQKDLLQKLPKDVWESIVSWMTMGWLTLILGVFGGGFDQGPNKNLTVNAAINYLTSAIAKVDRRIAALSGSSAEESFFDEDDCYEPATEGQNWQSIKSILGKKSRQARKLIRSAKVLAENDPKAAITSLRQAKVLLQDQKDLLLKLPKDMWESIASWMAMGWLTLIMGVFGGGFDQGPNKNLTVNAAINYLTSAIAKVDRKIASLSHGGDASSADESFSSFINACEAYTIPGYERRNPFLFD